MNLLKLLPSSMLMLFAFSSLPLTSISASTHGEVKTTLCDASVLDLEEWDTSPILRSHRSGKQERLVQRMETLWGFHVIYTHNVMIDIFLEAPAGKTAADLANLFQLGSTDIAKLFAKGSKDPNAFTLVQASINQHLLLAAAFFETLVAVPFDSVVSTAAFDAWYDQGINQLAPTLHEVKHSISLKKAQHMLADHINTTGNEARSYANGDFAQGDAFFNEAFLAGLKMGKYFGNRLFFH